MRGLVIFLDTWLVDLTGWGDRVDRRVDGWMCCRLAGWSSSLSSSTSSFHILFDRVLGV